MNASAKPRVDLSERSADIQFSASGALVLKGLDDMHIKVKEDDRSLDGSFGVTSAGGYGWSRSKYVRGKDQPGDSPLPWNLDDPREIWHKLVYLNRLGQGASGVVDKKIDAVSLELVAVKQVALNDAEAVKSIVAELNILKGNLANEGGHQLEGSIRNLVALYGCYFDRGTNQLCLVMEYCEGGSLQDLIDTGEPLSQENLVTIARDAFTGLWFIHAHGKIHRDIKPGNLLIDRIGRVKVADFGLAREVDNLQAETFAGTTTYMSPERLKGEPYSSAADVWGVGLSLLTAALGRFPIDVPEGQGYWFLYRALCEAEDPGRQIDRWLEAHREHLNAFGDPQGTHYPHGSPLVGGPGVMPVDRHDYVRAKFAPAQPWVPPVTGVCPALESALMYSPLLATDAFTAPFVQLLRSTLLREPASRASCQQLLSDPLLRDLQLEDEEAYYEPDAEDAGAGEDVDEEELDAIVEKVFDFLEKSRAVDLGGTYGQHFGGLPWAASEWRALGGHLWVPATKVQQKFQDSWLRRRGQLKLSSGSSAAAAGSSAAAADEDDGGLG